MKTQSEATIACVLNLCSEKNYDHSPHETVYKDLLTTEDITFVVNFVTAGILNEDIGLSEKSKVKFQDDDKGLRRYVVGLVNDRLRKAKTLNGNVKYEAKEPGKLINSRDPEMKSLKQVLEITTKTEDREAIQVEIDRRQIELDKIKPKTVAIQVEHLSPELRAKLGL